MKDVFKKVHLSDKKKILKKVIADRIVWLIKTESNDVQQVIPKKINDEKYAECSFLDGKEFDLKNSELGVISINHDEDKYFFYGLVSINNGKVYVDIQGDLFYLQRRKSARLELPENYNARCKIIDFKGKALPFECDIVDISSGGCKISLKSLEPLIKAETILKLKITLGHRSSFEVYAQVRHAKPIRDLSELPQVMGVQFVNYDSMFESKMLNLYMDVQREIFLKYIKK